MPITTPHQSQAGINVAGGSGGGGQHASLSAFVTPSAQKEAAGLETFSRGLDKFSDAALGLVLERRRQENAVDLLRDKLELEDAYRQFDSQYREQNKGASAREAEEHYDKFFQDRRSILHSPARPAPGRGLPRQGAG